MCGIAGQVAFDHDPTTNDVADVEAMTLTMANRGPDAAGVWRGSRVVLGHRRLSVIDLDGGRQPMVEQLSGENSVALTYSGEVYNFRELRAELEQHGHRFRTSSDTEVVLRAYLQWGTSFVHRLNGMFAFALWDDRSQELILVRDRLGIKPLFWYPTPTGALFGSEPKAILAHSTVKGVVDLDCLREAFSMTKSPGRTAYAGMREVVPGTIVRVTSGGARAQEYWAVTADDHLDDLDTTVSTVRDLLDDIVRRQRIADVPQCVLLSGGLDSSIITALAARDAAEQGSIIPSFSVDFDDAENFVATEMRAELDTPFAWMLARHTGTEHTAVTLDHAQLAEPAIRAATVRARDVASGWGDMDTSLYLLFRAIREKSTVALSGEGADEIFGGYPWFHWPHVFGAKAFPWNGIATKGLGDPAAHRYTLLSPTLRDALDMDAFNDAEYRRAVADVPLLAGESPTERRMREISHMHITRWLPTLLDRKDRMSMAVGLEVRVPFCDHRLVQYMFNVPWSMKTYDGREKSILRAAARGLVPDAIIDRKKASYAVTQNPEYLRVLRGALANATDGPDSVIAPFLDQRAVAEAVSGATNEGRSAIELVLALDLWLRQSDLSLAP